MACICVPSGIQTRDLSNNILYLNSRYQCLRPLSHHGWIKSDIMTITFFVITKQDLISLASRMFKLVVKTKIEGTELTEEKNLHGLGMV